MVTKSDKEQQILLKKQKRLPNPGYYISYLMDIKTGKPNGKYVRIFYVSTLLECFCYAGPHTNNKNILIDSWHPVGWTIFPSKKVIDQSKKDSSMEQFEYYSSFEQLINSNLISCLGNWVLTNPAPTDPAWQTLFPTRYVPPKIIKKRPKSPFKKNSDEIKNKIAEIFNVDSKTIKRTKKFKTDKKLHGRVFWIIEEMAYAQITVLTSANDEELVSIIIDSTFGLSEDSIYVKKKGLELLHDDATRIMKIWQKLGL